MLPPASIRILLSLLFVASMGSHALAGIDLASWEICDELGSSTQFAAETVPERLLEGNDRTMEVKGEQGTFASNTPIDAPLVSFQFVVNSQRFFIWENVLSLDPIPIELLKIPIV